MQPEDSPSSAGTRSGGTLSWPLRPAGAATVRLGSSPAAPRPPPPRSAGAKRHFRSHVRRGFSSQLGMDAEDSINVAEEPQLNFGDGPQLNFGEEPKFSLGEVLLHGDRRRDFSAEPKLKFGGLSMDAERSTTASAEPKLRLGDLLGLVTGLLVDEEFQAATLLLSDLMSSLLADVELPFGQSVFKHQLVKFLDGNEAKVNKQALVSIRRCIEGQSQLISEADTMIRSAASSRNASKTIGVVGKSKFRCHRLTRAKSMTVERPVSDSRPAGALPDGDCSDHVVTPRRASLRCDDREVLDSMGTTHGEGDAFFGCKGVQKSIAPAAGAPSYRRGEEHEASRKRIDSIDDQGDEGSFGVDSMDDLMAPARAKFFHGEEADLYGDVEARRGSKSSRYDGTSDASMPARGAASSACVEDSAGGYPASGDSCQSIGEGGREIRALPQAPPRAPNAERPQRLPERPRKPSHMLPMLTRDQRHQPSFFPSPRR